MSKSILRVLIVAGIVNSLAVGPAYSDKLSLQLSEVPIVDVLNMIADQNNLNLVISGEIDGSVTMRLENVDVITALDAILDANNYSYQIQDGIIVVRSSDADLSAQLISRVVTLKYVDPEVVKKALDTRKSDAGEIIILEGDNSDESDFEPNSILISELPERVDAMMAIIDELDVQQRLVQIEVKFIETQIDDNSKLGFVWPSAITATGKGATDGTVNTSNTTTTESTSDDNVGVYKPSDGSWTWGTLSVGQVNLMLDLLDQEGNSRLLSNPKITTIENFEAEIEVNTVIPIQTVNRFSEGAVIQDIVTFQDEEVGITLRVTPRICGDGRITMEVNPEIEDIIGYTGPADNQKPITTQRSIRARITVGDSESVVLGGLFKENEIETVQRVPLLGHIPILGSVLFSNKSVQKSTTDLMILITPKVL